MAQTDNVHYNLHLTVEKVTKKNTSVLGRELGPKTGREVVTLSNVTVRKDSFDGVLKLARGHIELLENDLAGDDEDGARI